MVLAKENKKAPKSLAESIIKELKKNKNYKKIELAGPGFINFYLAPSFFQRIFWDIRESGENYATSDFGLGEKVLLEFISANPTGPLNIVSARAAAFGDTLYRVMKRVGFAPSRVLHQRFWQPGRHPG
jgi:arginyl-tRNA synthetase